MATSGLYTALFVQPETLKIEGVAKDAATVLTLKLERMEGRAQHRSSLEEKERQTDESA